MGPSAQTTVRVALVEDHRETRDELARLLTGFHPRVALVAAFPDAESFLEDPVRLALDVALVDLGLPGATGIEAIRRLSEVDAHVHAIAFTAFDDERHVVAALRAGAYGYLLKDEPPDRVLAGIEEAAAGEHPVSARVAGFLVARARTKDVPPPVALSDRENELAAALAAGQTYAECAESMGIALGTVQDYVKRLYRKLDVNSRREVRAWVERYVELR